MKKIIQITNAAAENGESLYALTEDGKVYRLESKEVISASNSSYPMVRSTGVKNWVPFWNEIITYYN